jgi:20S proteasome alpha/beta subunit
MSLYQALREPPILTAVIGARCLDGIVLIADRKITRRVNNEKLESTFKKKIAGDLSHFLISYTGPKLTFDIFRKFMVGDLAIDLATNKMRFSTHISRAANCIKEINKVAVLDNKIEILAVSHAGHNSVLYHVSHDGFRSRILDYVSIGSGQEVADHFCKSIPHNQTSMKAFAMEAFLAIKFMDKNRKDLKVGGSPTVQYMNYDNEQDNEAPPKDTKEFMRYAKQYLKNFDKQMKTITAKSKRELMKRKRS